MHPALSFSEGRLDKTPQINIHKEVSILMSVVISYTPRSPAHMLELTALPNNSVFPAAHHFSHWLPAHSSQPRLRFLAYPRSRKKKIYRGTCLSGFLFIHIPLPFAQRGNRQVFENTKTTSPKHSSTHTSLSQPQ